MERPGNFVNEILFFIHVFIVIAFALIALRMGQSSLISLFVFQGVLANVFVMKQISLFGFCVTCSDVFMIGSIISLNFLQEFFGKESAKSAIRISLLSQIFFVVMAQMHLLYTPSYSDLTHSAFQTIFSSTMRIVFASIATFYVVQQWDVFFYSFLSRKMTSLSLKMALSMLVSQLLDTLLFSFLGLYGLIDSIWSVITLSFFIKSILIFVSAPLTALSKKWVKNVPV